MIYEMFKLLPKYDVPCLFWWNFLLPKHDSTIWLLLIDLNSFIGTMSFKTLLHDGIFLFYAMGLLYVNVNGL